jgi:diguanylate cyclase (GGDEF)-like protein
MSEGKGDVIKISKNPTIQSQVSKVREDLIGNRTLNREEELKINKYARSSVARDITLKKVRDERDDAQRAKNEALEKSGIDALTGLHNFRWFTEQLEMKISESNRNNASFKLIGFDIDRFKWINDTYGHGVGDEILKSIKSIPTREEEQICREGGDEYKQTLGAESTTNIEIMTSRLMEEMETLSTEILKDKKPFPNIPNKEIPEILKKAVLCVGVAEYTPGMSKEDLLHAVDNAQYYAKQNGRGKAAYATRLPNGDYAFKELRRIAVSKPLMK